jgi:SAM-dependent MidA family methyltransferase
VTPAGRILAEEIRNSGPIPFSRFMETALYHPQYGYYRSTRDPFGREGDFYTAEQVQPVFGILIRDYVRRLKRELGTGEFRVAELGAGREEMAPYLAEFGYLGVDIGRGSLPSGLRGLIFANEFFDALPVDVYVKRPEGFRQMRVALGSHGQSFVWVESERAPAEVEEHLARFSGEMEEGDWREAGFQALRWMDRIASCLDDGYLLAIDYGYTSREAVRFPRGTLMSYRRHTAMEEVLEEPGERDITAHVNFTALAARAEERGLCIERFETLAQTLLRAGEADRFAAVLEGGDEVSRVRRRLQLKTLLYGMGESFRTLLARKAGPK